MSTSYKFLKVILSVLALACFAEAYAAKETKTIAKAKAERTQEMKKRQGKPHVVSDADAAKAQNIRAKTINSIVKLLKTTKENGRRYELMRRLGEMYVEQAEYRLSREIVDFEKRHNAWQKAGKKGNPPSANYERSTASLKSGVIVYEGIIKNFPNSPGVDVTYYELGKLLLRLEDERGIGYLTQLVKRFPKSELIPETYLALGEHYFDKHKILEARGYYIKAAAFKSSPTYPYIIYKLGWAYYNSPAKDPGEEMQNKKLAISAFKLVVQLASQRTINPSQIYLRQEAINDLIIVWAETEDINSAWTYFRSIGSEDSFYVMLEKLGDIYVEQGENTKAVVVFQRILKESPLRPNNVQSHAKLVSLYDEENKPQLVQANLKIMADRYMKKSQWRDANHTDTELLKTATETVEKNLHRYASLYHKRAQKSNDKALFGTAAEIYALYLINFPNSEKAYDLRYLMADCLFEVERYELAAVQYDKVVSMNEKDGKYLHEAAMNSVIAMNKVVTAGKYADLPPAGQVPKPLTIPAQKVKLLASLDQYIRLFPKKKEAIPMKISAAEVQYMHGYYDNAIARYESVTKENLGSPESEAAVKVILSHYKERKDWEKVIAYTRTFLDAKGLLKGKLRDSTKELLVQASFNRALALEVQKKYAEAAVAFHDFQRSFPKEENAPRALYNAMVNYYRVPDLPKAVDAGKSVVKEYPKFERNADIIITIADTYEGLADFPSAASNYEYFAKLWPADRRASGALYNAAILYKGTKSFDKSIVALNLFIARYPKNPLTRDAYLELAAILSDTKKNAEAIATYNLISQNYGKDFPDIDLLARAKAAQLGLREADPSKAVAAITTLRREFMRKGAPEAIAARRLVAQSSVDLVEPQFKEFVGFTVKNQTGDAAKVIEAKQKKLVALARAYDEIVAIGSAEQVVASLYKVGEAHDAFARFIETFPGPREYSPTEQEEFQKSLSAGAAPLKEQAFKYYELAFNRSFEYQVFNEYGKLSYEKISKLKPKAYPEVKEFQVEPGYLAHSLNYDESVATSLQ